MLLLLAFQPAVPAADDAGPLPVTVAVLRNFPPQYSTSPAGTPEGFAVDVMEAVARRAHLQVTYLPVDSWSEMYAALRSGDADVVPNNGITNARRAVVDFTAPIETFSVSLFVRSNSPDRGGLDGLAGKSVAAVATNVGVNLARSYGRVNVEVYSDIEQALGHLLSGTVDGLVFPEPIVWKVAQRAGLEHRIKRVGPPLLEVKRAMAVAKGRTDLLARLNPAIAEFVGSSEFEDVYAKWYGEEPPMWSDATVWWAIGAAFGGVVLLMTGWRYHGVLQLNRRLRAESRERERTEEQLRQAQKMEAVGRLAGGIAHDFNNMLQIIQGFAMLAAGKIGRKHPAHEDLDKVLRSVDNATALTRQLLTFSRHGALERRALDVNEFIVGQSDMLRRLIGDDIELVTAPATERLLARADAGMMGQVLMNLVINARDAMPDGGRILIEAKSCTADAAFCSANGMDNPDSYLCIAVSDSGIGMSPEVRSRIFEPFFTTKHAGRGTGLGLSMVYAIVQRHDGVVTVDSEEGAGSTFNVFLPRIDETTQPMLEAGRHPAPGGHETILIAEDEADVLELLAGLLRGAGYEVLTAADGTEAVELFRANADRIALVILDVVMPGLGGRATYEQIRALDASVPVLFSSGHTANVLDAEFIERQHMRLIRKPYSPDTLLHAVRDTVDKVAGSPFDPR